STTCTATVSDTDTGTPSSATGQVNFYTSGSGAFYTGTAPVSTPLTSHCTLPSSTCSDTYTASVIGTGTHTISADYQGDATHKTSTGTKHVSFTNRATPPELHSFPTRRSSDLSTTCTATVSDTDTGTPSSATGQVNFYTSGSGAF